ncbi:glycosyltransferase [Fulvivirgaceae bacterium PWU4]|uniref:Glycosyltransferase n=1 Tax=Chryseosolibacter histidini TaxID=2782349 RepID=A0AAP2DKN9_9BACT|nr:glycosyltransferase [Chryseosolibacter histidini]MBT1696932.1 glycosyltransferase [Chryseosolibacter histidini]
MAEVKRKIVIASVLKPVNDTRMAEKIGQSLATEGYDVHVIGFPATTHTPGLTSHPLPRFNRLSLQRLLMPWKILHIVLSLRPALLIITTHELLLPAVILKLLRGIRIVYDVQENYYRNILYLPAFPRVLRPLIALYVRMKEYITAPAVDHFFLAEQGYAKELSFPGKRFTVLENKVKLPETRPTAERNPWQLLFSGTLAETTGVFHAIDIAVGLHRLEPRITLLLIGYCARPQELSRIRNVIAPYPFIRLTGGDTLVPHPAILSAIQGSGAGIIAYPYNESTRNSTPTKLFEYLGLKLPIILINHQPWIDRCAPYAAACVFDSAHIDAENLLSALKNQHFYFQEPANVRWADEEPRLMQAISHLLN